MQNGVPVEALCADPKPAGIREEIKITEASRGRRNYRRTDPLEEACRKWNAEARKRRIEDDEITAEEMTMGIGNSSRACESVAYKFGL